MKKIHLMTQGCSANQADSEIMAGLLKEEGFPLVDDPDKAEVIVFNTCTVKGPTESFFRKTLEQLKEQGKIVIIAGCIPQSEKNKEQFKEHSMIGTYDIDSIVEVVNQTIGGNTITLLGRKNKNRLNLPRLRKNNLVEIVPICHGCRGSCTYCKTKYARGELFSYPIKDIVRQISKAIDDGVKEVWLSSQDDGAYGLDINTYLPQLLTEITTIPKDFKIRVGMANPDFILSFIDKLIEVFKHEKIYKFLHIPVQSGNNKILKEMNRKYTVEKYKRIIERFKEKIPEITIATDIICGFPTESREQFMDSIKLIRETKPDVVNISRFWPRPGTPAAKIEPPMDAAKWGIEVKYRTKKMTDTFHKIALANNKKWIGWKGNVLITEKGKKKGTFIGRNYAYKQTIVESKKNLLGKELTVKIADATKFDLRAKILLESRKA